MWVHVCVLCTHKVHSSSDNTNQELCVLWASVLATEIKMSGSHPLLYLLSFSLSHSHSLLSSPLLSLLLGYWLGRALWVQRVKAWKAKQPRFQRSHESLKCLLFPTGPGRRVRCVSDPRAHLEIQWLNLAHPTLNQSIPIISYCLPSATGPDDAWWGRERERENTFWRPRSGGSCAYLTVYLCVCVSVFCGSPLEGESVSMLWACVSLTKVTVLKNLSLLFTVSEHARCLFACGVEICMFF